MSEPRFFEKTGPLSPEEAQNHPKLVHGTEPMRSEGIRLDELISPLRSLRAQAEIKGIQYALKLTGWNRKQAAHLLKISYRGLLYKIRQHNITRNAQ